jgi:4-carboxymuconolactone decarboxylase
MNPTIEFPLSPTDARTFHGRAYSRLIGAAESEEPVKLYFVRFEAGARTHWHSHSGAQILVVTSGRCRYQREGEPASEAAAGQSIRFEAGVRHWHGASSAGPAEHIAVNLDSRETVWMEAVTEAQFRGDDPHPHSPALSER